MCKIRPGNKINSWLNGEWAKHGKPWGKKIASKRRRKMDDKIIRDSLKEE